MLILALDTALGHCTVGLVANGVLCAGFEQQTNDRPAVALPTMVAALLKETGVSARDLALITVTVGPGSFTGVRAGLAFAHGLALGAGVPVVGVTVGEALAESLPHLGDRDLWTAIDSGRRGHIFLERRGSVLMCAIDALPEMNGALAIAGDIAIEVASRLAARDADVMSTDARRPAPVHIAAVGTRRQVGLVPMIPTQPILVNLPAVQDRT